MRERIIKHLQAMRPDNAADKPNKDLVDLIEADLTGPIDTMIEDFLRRRVTPVYVAKMYAKTLKPVVAPPTPSATIPPPRQPPGTPAPSAPHRQR
jgi:hypothetical protein